MLQDLTTIKEAVTPSAMQKDITSSWHDFWSFEIVAGDAHDRLTIGTLVIALICFIVGVMISKWLSRRLTKRIFSRFELAPSAQHLWTSMTFYVSCLFVTLVALKIAHVPLTIFTLMGGAVALGIGFGSKNLVNNFMSGVIFIFDAPARVGDFVEVEGYFGRVDHVGMRATYIEIGTSRKVVIPNSSFLEKPIVNWGRAGSPIYIAVGASVDVTVDLARLEKTLLAKLKNIPQVIDTMAKRVLLKGFVDSGYSIEVSVPIEILGPGDRDNVASSVRKKIDEIFREEKIASPRPQVLYRQVSAPAPENPPKLD